MWEVNVRASIITANFLIIYSPFLAGKKSTLNTKEMHVIKKYIKIPVC